MLSVAGMAHPCLTAPTYQRRQPEQTVLYRTIAAHLPTFLARTAGADGTGGWPAFVRREFEAYLRCGILEHGLLRVRCERCGDTTVVGFSCCLELKTIWSLSPSSVENRVISPHFRATDMGAEVYATRGAS